MIKLDVENYCHGCTQFEPINYEVPMYQFNVGSTPITFGDFVVRCEHHEKCAVIHKYLKSRENDKCSEDLI